MIPKIIHYCWLSTDPIPSDLQNYIDGWQQKMPDYQIIKWDFSRFEKQSSKWVSDAFDHKKYAFAADYIRAYALYNYGGFYLDSDVEVLKSFDSLLNHDYLLCYENGKNTIEAGIMASSKGNPLFKILLDYYDSNSFIQVDGSFNMKVIPVIIRDIIIKNYSLKSVNNPSEISNTNSEVCVLPFYYFSPKSSFDGSYDIREDTYAVHHFKASWLPKYMVLERTFWNFFGLKNYAILYRLNNIFKKKI